MHHCPTANETMPLINRSVVFVAEDGNGDVALVLLAFIIHFGLRELHRPSCIPILLPQLCWLGLPVVGYLACLDIGLLSTAIALQRAATTVASTICPPSARYPAFER